MTVNIAIFASHPIQYKAPLYQAMADDKNIDLTVFYGSKHGIKPTKLGFGEEQTWNLPLLDGYQSVFLKNHSWRESPNGYFSLINPEIVRRLKSSYDVLFIHTGYFRFSSVLALIGAKHNGIPILLHGTGHENRPDNYLPPWYVQPIKKLYVRSFLHYVDAVLADCTANKRFYQSYGVKTENLYLMPAAVDNERLQQAHAEISSQQTKELRKELGIPEKATVILFVGKLIKRKRPFDLLKAFENLDVTASVYVLFVGDGNLREKLESYCSEHSIDSVVFAGYQDQESLPLYYKLGDLFVLPSAYDSSGKVINEAMNFELPVVSTESVGVSEDLIKDNGRIFKTGDIESLVEILQDLLTSPEKLKRMGKISRSLIADWNFENDIKVLKQAINDVTPGGGFDGSSESN